MTDITIYHNPKCGTSRNTLALIRNSGAEPKVIHYLETPPTREELVALIARIGLPIRDIMRQKESIYSELIWVMKHGRMTLWSTTCCNTPY